MLNKLIKKAGSIIGMTPDSLEMIMEQRMGKKLKNIMQNNDHPMHSHTHSMFVMPRFVPAVGNFFNEHCHDCQC